MKKIMIALLVVASIFVLASCTAAPVTTTLTITSTDCEPESLSALATIADGAKAYTKDSSGAYTEITSKALTYGTLVVAQEVLAGSSQDSWKFTYTGALGKDGSETALTVYIGVLNSDGKSFKTQCATVTVNAKAVWTGTKEISVALSNNKTTASETLVSTGESIYVDDKAYTAAVDVKSAAGVKIGTLAAELSTDKKTVKFTFTDSLDKYADSVSGVAQTVVVKNGTTTVGTYKVACSHVGTTPTYIAVELINAAQSDDDVEADYSLTTEKETLAVWKGESESSLKKIGYISTDATEDDGLYIDIVNDDIIDDWSVGKIWINPVGRSGKALSGVNFVLDTDFEVSSVKGVNSNGALGSGSADYYIVIKDSDDTTVESFRVSAVVTPLNVGINSVVGKVTGLDEKIKLAESSLFEVYVYDEVEKEWVEVVEPTDPDDPDDYDVVPLYDAESDEYVGKIYLDENGDIIFDTEAYGKSKASYGSGVVKVGLNNNGKDLFEGEFNLIYENVEASEDVSTKVEVTDAKGLKGYFEIDGETSDTLYCRYINSYSSTKGYGWSDWFKYDASLAAEVYGFNYSKNCVAAGTLDSVNHLKGGTFKCRFLANTTETKTYGQTGYYQLAVVDEEGLVVATYWVAGENGYEAE